MTDDEQVRFLVEHARIHPIDAARIIESAHVTEPFEPWIREAEAVANANREATDRAIALFLGKA